MTLLLLERKTYRRIDTDFSWWVGMVKNTTHVVYIVVTRFICVILLLAFSKNKKVQIYHIFYCEIDKI